jgi:hypothetical protein
LAVGVDFAAERGTSLVTLLAVIWRSIVNETLAVENERF